MKTKIENTPTVAYKSILEQLFERIAWDVVISDTFFPYRLYIEGDDVEIHVTISVDDMYSPYLEESTYRRIGTDFYITHFYCTEWGFNNPKYEYILRKAAENQIDFMLKEGMLEIQVEA